MCIAKPKLVARFLLALTLVAGAVGVARQPEPTAPAAQPAQKPQAQSQPEEKAALRWSPGATLDREDPDGTGASAVALSPDGKWALTGHDNGKLRLCNALTGTELEVLSGQPGKVWAIRFIRDGQAVVSVSETGVRWWALPGGKLLTKSPWSPGKVQCLAVSGDGRTVAAGIGGGKVLLHDLDDKSEDVSFQVHQGLVMALAWSTDGKTLATGGGDATVRLWDVRSRRDPVIFKGPGKAMVRGVAFAPDGKLLASAHGREGVVLRDVKTAKELRVLQGQGQTYTAVAFAPDGKLLATGTANGTVRLWNLDTGRPRATFKEHAGQIHTLTFGADGKMLASVSFDGTVRLWRGSTPDGKEPEEPKVTARELDILLADLRGTDETRAVQAARSLAVLPRQGVELLKGQLRPVKAASSDRVAKLLADLDSARFATREKAYRELEQLGDAIHSVLTKALKSSLQLESLRRVEALLERLRKGESSPEMVFARRAIGLLERFGNREARQVLANLASGVPDAHLTRYARSALERMDEQ